MHIVRGRPAEAASEQRTSTFTGVVFADPVLPATDGTTVNNVFFTPGARTYWHTHEYGQLLLVTIGTGLVCTHGEEPERLHVGDVVWVPPGETHWHGGTASTCLGHTAVSLGTTTWLDPVSDAEYALHIPPSQESR